MWLLSDKIKVRDSGLLEGCCDLHCHLLPGVDDGVDKQEEAMTILDTWESLGMSEVWLTPHIMEDIPNHTAKLREKYETLKSAYSGNIKLRLAAENMLDGLFVKRLNNNDLLTIGKSMTYLLVETSYFNPPMDMAQIIDKVREHGYYPLLAHPERYQYMNMNDYRKWKQKGVSMQLNMASLGGAYGPVAQKKAEQLLDRDLYDCCGTDTHSSRFVEFFLNSKLDKKTIKKVRKIIEAQMDF